MSIVSDALKQLRTVKNRDESKQQKEELNAHIMTAIDKMVIDCEDYNQIYGTQEGKAIVNIIQSSNQTITVSCGNKLYTETFVADIGIPFTVSISPNTGYTAGELNYTSGTIFRGLTINASTAEIAMYKISIVQSNNQTITVTNGSHSYTNDFFAAYGTEFNVSIVPDAGYTAGELNYTKGIVSSNMIINATPATVNTYSVNIIQTDGQTIHVYIPDKKTGIDHVSSKFYVLYDTPYEAEVIPDDGISKAGELFIDKTGTIKNDIYISARSPLEEKDDE